MPPSQIFPFPTFVKICMIFIPPRFSEDACCVQATIWSGRLTLLLITAPLVSYALSVTLNQGDFVFYCTRVFLACSVSATWNQVDLVLCCIRVPLAISARARANHADMVLYSSRRLWADGLSATEHYVALDCCCTHRSRQHVAAIENHWNKLQIAQNRR